MTTDIPLGFKLHSWYCPALLAYRRPGEEVSPEWQFLLHRLPWVPLYSTNGLQRPAGWTLRSYYSVEERAFYASHRTISEKTLKQTSVLELYAPPGAYGNDHAAHVPPSPRLGSPR